MKKNILKAFGLLAFTAGMAVGCTDDFDSMNKNPMGITEGDPGYIMSYIQEVGTRIDAWPYQVGDNLHTNLYAQYFANSVAHFNSDSYTYNNAWVNDGFWIRYYAGVLKHLRKVEEMVIKSPEYDNIYQTMRIFAASCTAQITDMFGDVPYSEAGTGNSAAKFDSQQSIYASLFKELTDAVNALNAHKDDNAYVDFKKNQDLVYDGDFEKWIKLANSLRLRLAMRLSFVDPATSKREAEAALAAPGGVFANNADNAGVFISGAGNCGWPLFQISGWGEFCMSKTMEDILKKLSTVADPRMTLWFGHTETSTVDEPVYAGIPNGLPASELGQYPDRSYVWGAMTMPNWNTEHNKEGNFKVLIRQRIMNYAEVCLLKAEAALRNYAGAGNAEQNYLAGIQASFDAERSTVDKDLYSTEEDEAYKTTGSVAWSSASDFEGHLKQIITQKWLAVYPNGVEAWSEFRRTGYPVLNPVKQSLEPKIKAENGEFIKKLRYVDDELRENPNATSSALNQGKGDGLHVRVWWDTGRYK